jgi:hypothetical protein
MPTWIFCSTRILPSDEIPRLRISLPPSDTSADSRPEYGCVTICEARLSRNSASRMAWACRPPPVAWYHRPEIRCDSRLAARAQFTVQCRHRPRLRGRPEILHYIVGTVARTDSSAGGPSIWPSRSSRAIQVPVGGFCLLRKSLRWL